MVFTLSSVLPHQGGGECFGCPPVGKGRIILSGQRPDGTTEWGLRLPDCFVAALLAMTEYGKGSESGSATSGEVPIWFNSAQYLYLTRILHNDLGATIVALNPSRHLDLFASVVFLRRGGKPGEV